MGRVVLSEAGSSEIVQLMYLIRCKTDGEGGVAVCEGFGPANGGRIGKFPSQRHHIFRHDADERRAYTARVRVSFERRPGTLLA